MSRTRIQWPPIPCEGDGGKTLQKNSTAGGPRKNKQLRTRKEAGVMTEPPGGVVKKEQKE